MCPMRLDFWTIENKVSPRFGQIRLIVERPGSPAFVLEVNGVPVETFDIPILDHSESGYHQTHRDIMETAKKLGLELNNITPAADQTQDRQKFCQKFLDLGK